MRTPLSDEEMQRLERYIERGGNLFILGEPNRQEAMNPVLAKFGVELMPGTLVQRNPDYLPSIITAQLTDQAAAQSPSYAQLKGWRGTIVMPDVSPLQYVTGKEYDIKPIAVTRHKVAGMNLNQRIFLTENYRSTKRSGRENNPIQLCFL